MRLKDKVAVVTGAASGIGKEIALVFAREGAKIAIADLDQKAAEATAREIDASGKRAIGVAMDVADEDQVEAGMAKVIKSFDAIDILVSNAGIQSSRRWSNSSSPSGRSCWRSISTAPF
jgi:3-hydroxybutyrate dehydrogenase